jgi:hypothetical protein
MSMLSAMTANLRNRANELRFFANGMGAPYILPETKQSMGISMRNAAVELEHAADTIDDLRRKCQDVQAENERLRETMAQMVHDHTEQGREVRALKALVRDMYKALTALDVDYCQACPRDTANGPCTAYVRAYDGCSFAVDMRDLGIEVKA